MGRRRFVASAVMGALAFVATTGVAEAGTLVVHPGQSIQRAVNRAHRGDTVRLAPGTYHQNVTIRKRISLVGAGWGPHGDRLFPGANPVPSVCSSPGSVHGICVAGRFDQNGNPIGPVRGVTIRNLSVHNFSAYGSACSSRTAPRCAMSRRSGTASTGSVDSCCTASASFTTWPAPTALPASTSATRRAPELSSPETAPSGAEPAGRRGSESSSATPAGDACGGNVTRNNCAGIVIVDSGENPVPTTHWAGWGNVASHNNLACGAEQGGGAPALSGIGITLFGASHSSLWRNWTNNNHPSGPSVFSGGIVVASAMPAGGADPVDDLVRRNHAHHNSPVDILYDGSGSGNRFVRNDCGTSTPNWICN